MKITVTQEHIDRGKRGKCDSCPIALAILDDVSIDEAKVGAIIATISRKKPIISWSRVSTEDYYLPQSAIDFVRKFDDSSHVEPFSFELINKITVL
jgi:hypothetical protein